MQPALQMAEERNMEKLKTEFFEKHEDLKGYEPLLVLIRDQFVAKGIQFKTKEEAFKAVADAAREHIQKIPGLQGGAGSGTSNGAGSSKLDGKAGNSRMPNLSEGKGQSGAGDQGGASHKSGSKSTAERIFG
jgi:hypothetical protein